MADPNDHKKQVVDSGIFDDAEMDDISMDAGASKAGETFDETVTISSAMQETIQGRSWGAPLGPFNPSKAEKQATTDKNPPMNWLLYSPGYTNTSSVASVSGVSRLEQDIAALRSIQERPNQGKISGNRNQEQQTKRCSPKSDLHALYGQKPRNIRTEKSDFYTWMEGPPHNMLFSSVFVCPITGEAFPAGRFGDESEYVTKNDPETGFTIVYFKRKVNAEHGAAARAHDCLVYRDNIGCDVQSQFVGKEDPTYSPGSLPLPSVIPTSLKNAISEAVEHRRKLSRNHSMNQDLSNDGSDFSWRPCKCCG